MIRSPAGFDGGDRIKRYLDYYQPSYGVMMLSAGQFSPAQLFANGEIGAWYDPSDLTTMFQDSAGTTPVTAVGQPVGLLLDKSKGLVLGSELVSNGTFDSTTTGWTAVNTPTLTIGSNGVAIQNNGTTSGLLYQAVSTVVGRSYKITATIVYGGAGFARVAAYASVPTAIFGGFIDVSSSGQFSCVFTASATTTYITIGNRNDNNATNTFDNISVKELAGNHASQTTSTSRPTLSARVNLLTFSEQFDNAAWTKTRSSISSDAAVAPDGTTTADKLIEDTTASDSHFVQQNATVINATQYTWTVYAKAAERSFICLYNSSITKGKFFNLSTGAVGTDLVGAPDAASITDAGNGWYRCSITFTTTGTSAGLIIYIASANGTAAYTGNGTSGILIWGADLRTVNQPASLPTYQRIAAATDYDTTGFPYYLSFDGTDDFLVTGTINPGSADKAQVFAGVRKLSDATRSIVAETGTGSSNGTIAFEAPFSPSATYGLYSRGTIQVRISSTTEYPSPITNVASVIADISAPSILLRVNGAQNVTNSSTQGTGSYSSQALYIGRRGGTTLPFNGNIYSLIVRFGPNLDTTTISNTETWVNGKTLAY